MIAVSGDRIQRSALNSATNNINMGTNCWLRARLARINICSQFLAFYRPFNGRSAKISPTIF